MLTSTILESTNHCRRIPANAVSIYKIFKKQTENRRRLFLCRSNRFTWHFWAGASASWDVKGLSDNVSDIFPIFHISLLFIKYGFKKSPRGGTELKMKGNSLCFNLLALNSIYIFLLLSSGYGFFDISGSLSRGALRAGTPAANGILLCWLLACVCWEPFTVKGPEKTLTNCAEISIPATKTSHSSQLPW